MVGGELSGGSIVGGVVVVGSDGVYVEVAGDETVVIKVELALDVTALDVRLSAGVSYIIACGVVV